MKKYRWVLFALVGLLMACGATPTQRSSTSGTSPTPKTEPITLTVSAAADLNYVFPEIGKRWEQETGNKVTFNLGSTGQLAQQIERGAPVDLFAAANRKFVEELDRHGLVFSETKELYGVGRLTLWQREDSPLEIRDIKDLTSPEVKRVAIANPDHAPYGVAAREALQSAGIWDELQPKLILGENIKQTQQYAETGNVDVAIAALSISVGKPGKWVLVPENLHKPLEQMLVVPKNAPHPEAAKQFAAFINGERGRPLMRKYGFVLPGETLAVGK
ncbi:molybdate ABC transporter substrate-binding protein [Leptothermofonsia sichuanensis E412]|uniref:molybdate ABC transporter substrate-binding protein n=1 Tax=Leptothermofonsia sichuanensis TaxID=2917832 RepID=UPI001CA6C39C|nr:molybdate ABC transporter substrate-binding protein [Leptothermofonsia sichuanensis]QZZ20590.1 molybdate ABC transporter substrate-binding protein [Leptothermofonsia sichuanensis E412]